MKQTILHCIRKSVNVVLVIGLIVSSFAYSTPAGASAITNRKITASNSAGGATGVTYTLTTNALPTTGTAVRSVSVDICDTASGTCTNSGSSAGFSALGSTLASQPSGLGIASGWAVSAASQYSLRITHASNSATPSGTVQIVWNGVANPTTANSTYYARVTTYSGSSYTGALDTGVVALSTSSTIQVALAVNETLTFCAGTSITNENCGTISGNQVNLGTGSTTSTSSGTSVFAASTNGGTGYTVTVNGTALNNGSYTMATPGGASTIGTEQFGMNLVANTTPSVGVVKTGTGTASVDAAYATTNTFPYTSGSTVVSVLVPTNANKFTVSYIANIGGTTPPGSYVANLNYIATANF